MLRAALVVVIALAGAACKRDEPAPPATAPGGPTAPALDPALVVAVDARIELVSIVARLAGFPEYGEPARTAYLRAADAHFAPWRDHPAVARARACAPSTASRSTRRSRSPSTSTTPSPRAAPAPAVARPRSAVEPGRPRRGRGRARRLRPPERPRRLPRRSAPVPDRGRGPRRRGAGRPPLRGLARGHVRPAPGHLPRHPRADHRQPGLRRVRRRRRRPGAGGAGPVPATARRRRRTAPRADAALLLVHELLHSHVNPALDADRARLEPVAAPLFARVEAAMARQHYRDVMIMVNESVVRALVVLYARDRGAADVADRQLVVELRSSFLWTRELVAALDGARQARGGRLPPDVLAATTRDTFAAWAAANP
ncbi:MAG: DUF4932 domain-containing protein [Kofleriaceae bacterium]|nr:DUF4932 domain-containing protein [Kofleriaceae bacterium]